MLNKYEVYYLDNDYEYCKLQVEAENADEALKSAWLNNKDVKLPVGDVVQVS